MPEGAIEVTVSWCHWRRKPRWTTIASGAVVPRQPGRKFVCYTKCSTFWKLSVSRQLRRERRSQDEPTRVPVLAKSLMIVLRGGQARLEE